MPTPSTDYEILTPSAGIGVQGAGVTAAGLGEETITEPPPDPSLLGTRFLDPRTRDYSVDASTGQFAQTPPRRQQVLLAVMTEYGSATAAGTFGLKRPRTMRASFVADTQGFVRMALAHLTNENAPQIRIDDILVEKLSTGRALVTISFVDLIDGLPDQAQTTLG